MEEDTVIATSYLTSYKKGRGMSRREFRPSVMMAMGPCMMLYRSRTMLISEEIVYYTDILVLLGQEQRLLLSTLESWGTSGWLR
jgi:hypothetical protein